MITIAIELMTIPYNAKIIPNGKPHNIHQTGANCQVFAYHILRQNGFIVPDYRSSELWSDTTYSIQINEVYQPYDLLFFHKTQQAYGAHIAIYIGDNKAIHLSKAIGKPVVWEVETFFQYPQYQFLLGAKRFKKNK